MVRAERIFDTMENARIDVDEVCYNSLINVFVKNCDSAKASMQWLSFIECMNVGFIRLL